MALRLGIDTGGTFTDAVLIDTEKGILAKNKALTTYHDLFIGINHAVNGLLSGQGHRQKEISMVGLSTTLATNAMVQNHGRSACLVLIGQPDHVIYHPTLKQALGEDSTIRIKGGHKASGETNDELDLQALKAAINTLKTSVSGYAVAGYFSVRNPEHELAAKSLINDLTGLPVTCSHELTSKLDSPKRALTCLFNARLIPLLTSLINSIHRLLDHHAINAPVMVVQGDGSLVYTKKALQHPVETILSGPAASLHGARYLSNIENAIVSDIGGTTTDVAMLEDGAPTIDRSGARVGGWQTMVEAVSVNTRGLGGDSEVLLNLGKPTLSAQRAIPVCQLAAQYPHVSDILTEQLENDTRETDARFAVQIVDVRDDSVFRSGSEKRIYDILSQGPKDLNALYESPAFERALVRLRKRGIINVCAFTPTDALHVLATFEKWNRQDSINAARLMCRLIERQSDQQIDIDRFCQTVVHRVVEKSCRVLLETAVMHTYGNSPMGKEMNPDRLSEILLEQPQNIFFDSRIKFKQPIVAIGAPASMFYPQVAEKFSTQCIVPQHADVCNAVGAATSRVLQKVHGLITSPKEGQYRMHSSGKIKDFDNLSSALEFGKSFCESQARSNAIAAGGESITTKVSHHDIFVNGPGDYRLFIESKIIARAEGEPAGVDILIS